MENDNIINGNCWVAYFDILGFKEEVNVSEQKGQVRILTAYNEALSEINLHKPFCNAVWFSDSFIFYSSDGSAEIIEILARSFFEQMFLKTVPLRGCLNFGRFYADKKKNIYFGSALNDAYELAESQDWIGYILSKNAKEKMCKYRTKKGETCWDAFKSYYVEYDVPIKDRKRKLSAYKVGFQPWRNNESNDNLYYSFIRMLRSTQYSIENSSNLTDNQRKSLLEKVKTKYINTNDFLLKVYPQLEKEFRNSLCSLWQ